MGCHGVVRVLLEPLTAAAPWLARAMLALDGGPPCTLEVVWEGSPTRPLGTALVEPNEPDLRFGVFRQTLDAPTSLFVLGAGDDAQPVVALAADLGWRVTVADPRPSYATTARFPGARTVYSGSVNELIEAMDIMEGALVVIMTHHYVYDLPLLRAMLPLPVAYVGLLGPRRRAEKMLETLEAEGLPISEGMRSRLFAPIGLDVGAEGPEEIALSIIAEIESGLGRPQRPFAARTNGANSRCPSLTRPSFWPPARRSEWGSPSSCWPWQESRWSSAPLRPV